MYSSYRLSEYDKRVLPLPLFKVCERNIEALVRNFNKYYDALSISDHLAVRRKGSIFLTLVCIHALVYDRVLFSIEHECFDCWNRFSFPIRDRSFFQILREETKWAREICEYFLRGDIVNLEFVSPHEVTLNVMLCRGSLMKDMYTFTDPENEVLFWELDSFIKFATSYRAKRGYRVILQFFTMKQYLSRLDRAKKYGVDPVHYVDHQCQYCKAIEGTYEPDGKKFHRCKKCKKVWYCSDSCQKKDWGEHKKICISCEKN